jgi:hypothetical protein
VADQGPVVAIVGAKAFRADLRRASEDVQSPMYAALKAAGMSVAAPLVSTERESLPVSDVDANEWHRVGWLAESVRAYATRTGAGVRVGFPSGPVYAGWVEFGGARRDPHLSRREFVKDGRYLFPAAQSQGPAAAEAYQAAMQRVLNASVLWTNTGDDPGSVHD